mgnify:CR=1 FL=1
MIVYTADQIFNILGSVSCETDLIEIEHYVLSNENRYTWYDVELFKNSISDLYSALQK